MKSAEVFGDCIHFSESSSDPWALFFLIFICIFNVLTGTFPFLKEIMSQILLREDILEKENDQEYPEQRNGKVQSI
jgi:hypothetical protein